MGLQELQNPPKSALSRKPPKSTQKSTQITENLNFKIMPYAYKTTISLLFPYTATLHTKTTKIRQSLAGKNPI